MSFLEIIALITLLLKIIELTRKRTSTFAALLLPLNFFAIDKKRTA